MISFANKIKRLKAEKDDIKRQIRFLEDVETALEVCGLVGSIQGGPSLEDCWDGEYKQQLLDSLQTETPLELRFHRGWVGFAELTEYDHMQDYILPLFYKFEEEDMKRWNH